MIIVHQNEPAIIDDTKNCFCPHNDLFVVPVNDADIAYAASQIHYAIEHFCGISQDFPIKIIISSDVFHRIAFQLGQLIGMDLSQIEIWIYDPKSQIFYSCPIANREWFWLPLPLQNLERIKTDLKCLNESSFSQSYKYNHDLRLYYKT